MHFEDVWNGSEAVAKQLPSRETEQIIADVKRYLDKIPSMVTFPSKQAELLGEALFDLCALTEKLNINSAAALRLAIENRKADLLDPEEEKDET